MSDQECLHCMRQHLHTHERVTRADTVLVEWSSWMETKKEGSGVVEYGWCRPTSTFTTTRMERLNHLVILSEPATLSRVSLSSSFCACCGLTHKSICAPRQEGVSCASWLGWITARRIVLVSGGSRCGTPGPAMCRHQSPGRQTNKPITSRSCWRNTGAGLSRPRRLPPLPSPARRASSLN